MLRPAICLAAGRCCGLVRCGAAWDGAGGAGAFSGPRRRAACDGRRARRVRRRRSTPRPNCRAFTACWSACAGSSCSSVISTAGEPRRPANIKSASKSVISALVGIAIDRGFIKNVKQPVAAFFPRSVCEQRRPEARDHDRRSPDDAVGAGVDEQPELRRVGAERELGAVCPRAAAAGGAGDTCSTARATRTCCRRS